MGLKEDIKKVYEESIGGGSDNIEKLASGLEKAIENFIVNQTFTVKKLSATAVGVQGTTAPGTATGAAGPSVTNPTGVSIPKITVEVDETGGVANPEGAVQSIKSVVGLDKNNINRNY